MLIAILVFLSSSTLVYAKVPPMTAKELSIPPPTIMRTCCSFGFDLRYAGIPFVKKTAIISIDELGNHQFMGSNSEGNGNIYTKRGGFIDIGHLRDYADWTAYLYNLIVSKHENENQIFIDLGTEGGSKTLRLKLPEDFKDKDAFQLAGKIAYDLSLWHEIATWFGASYIPLIPERYSSFSPEDLYSNLLGIEIGIRALKSELDYDDAITQILVSTLDSLETVTTYEETYSAMKQVENIWWSKQKPLPSRKILIKRYFDSDSCLIPWLVPGIVSIKSAYQINKAEANLSDLYELRIKLNYKFPIKSIISSQIDRTITQRDFNTLVKYIELDEYNYIEKTTLHSEQNKRKEKRNKI